MRGMYCGDRAVQLVFTVTQDGPYVLKNCRLHHVSRLYDDNKGAFMVPTTQSFDDNAAYKPLQLTGTQQQSLAVLVPSRCFRSGRSWIEGKRIAVKEAFQVAGIQAALSNRAFYDVSLPAETTAPAIQQLLQLGAVMVGTTKCSSLISREDPIEGKSKPTLLQA